MIRKNVADVSFMSYKKIFNNVIIAFKFNLHLHCINIGRHLFKVHIILSSCISWELVLKYAFIFDQINYSLTKTSYIF